MNETANQKALSPGAAYVAKYLTVKCSFDISWVKESIDAGALMICPRCEFLHLPTFPVPLGLVRGPAPLDTCDVCAHAWGGAELDFEIDTEMLLKAREGLNEARAARAKQFYDLWMGASLAADTWVLARLGDVLAEVKAETRGPQEAVGQE